MYEEFMVETTGIEPVTSCMSSKHSNQLSYASEYLITAENRVKNYTDGSYTCACSCAHAHA